MRLGLLLDTNTIIWFTTGDRRLSRAAFERMTADDEDVFVSVVSAWEYGHKRKLRPEQLPEPFEELTGQFPCIRLPLDFEVHRFAETLPLIHKDPFDRMLIAQAMHHELTLIASDETIHRYPCSWLW